MSDENDVRIAKEATKRTIIRGAVGVLIVFGIFGALALTAILS